METERTKGPDRLLVEISMRVAICLSGHTRSYKQCFQSFQENLLECNRRHHIDVYISTWLQTDSFQSSQQDRRKHALVKIDKANISELVDMYRPKNIRADAEIDWDVSTLQPYFKSTPAAIVGMTYKIMTCDRMRRETEIREGFTYHAVVRTRFDALLNWPVYIDFIDLSVVQAPTMMLGHVSQPNLHGYKWINDKFAVANSQHMSIYADLHNHIHDLASEYPVQPEILLAAHLTRNQVPFRTLGFDLQILR